MMKTATQEFNEDLAEQLPNAKHLFHQVLGATLQFPSNIEAFLKNTCPLDMEAKKLRMLQRTAEEDQVFFELFVGDYLEGLETRQFAMKGGKVFSLANDMLAKCFARVMPTSEIVHNDIQNEVKMQCVGETEGYGFQMFHDDEDLNSLKRGSSVRSAVQSQASSAPSSMRKSIRTSAPVSASVSAPVSAPVSAVQETGGGLFDFFGGGGKQTPKSSVKKSKSESDVFKLSAKKSSEKKSEIFPVPQSDSDIFQLDSMKKKSSRKSERNSVPKSSKSDIFQMSSMKKSSVKSEAKKPISFVQPKPQSMEVDPLSGKASPSQKASLSPYLASVKKSARSSAPVSAPKTQLYSMKHPNYMYSEPLSAQGKKRIPMPPIKDISDKEASDPALLAEVPGGL
eukprot:GHVP01047451.1.p1 GENE.GHVP01047451.1~~GHVP01047451.1.p1  ORF type:complete len:396 (+),score=69.47 GHVP01047451.1:926-2113(+)